MLRALPRTGDTSAWLAFPPPDSLIWWIHKTPSPPPATAHLGAAPTTRPPSELVLLAPEWSCHLGERTDQNKCKG